MIESKRKAVIADPQSANAWGELGMAFDAHEQWPPSQECYRRAMELDPSDARWPFLLAEQMNWRVKSGSNKEEAVRLYRMAADLPPPTPAHTWTAALSLADLLTELGRGEEAAPLYRAGIRGRPGQPVGRVPGGRAAGRSRADRGRHPLVLDARPQPVRPEDVGRRDGRAVPSAGKAAEADKYEHAAEMLPADASWANPYAERVAELRRGRRC